MTIVIKTRDWEELLKALHTRNVGYAGHSESGHPLYAALLTNGCINPNPKVVGEYLA